MTRTLDGVQCVLHIGKIDQNSQYQERNIQWPSAAGLHSAGSI